LTDLDSAATAAGVSTDELMERKASIDERLRRARALRIPPARDDKIVTAWNALAMRAFAEAGAILTEPRYLERAVAIARFLIDEASPGDDLVRSWRDGPGHPAFAEDHAALAVGLFTLFQATGDARWFERAERHVQVLRSTFAADGGGFHTTRADSELLTRPIATQDNPAPSDNALAMEALLTHAAYTADTGAIVEAESTMRRLATTAMRHPAFGGYALAVWLTHLVGVREVAIVGEDTTAMEDIVWGRFDPGVVLAVGDGSPSLVPLLAGRPGTATGLGYVCEGLVCDLPVTTPVDLEAMLIR
jgi:uncharacterized protein YyaL (SSP411 family)